MEIDKVSLLHFSGTGNTYRAATWMANEAQKHVEHVSCEAVDTHGPDSLDPSPSHLVGMLMPAHGFTAPWKVIKCAVRLPRGEGAPSFCVTTRGGLMVGRWHPPGLAGTSIFLISLIMLLRGYKPRGVISINMPSNWFSLHPMQKKITHRRIIERSKPIAIEFMSNIIKGERVWFNLNTLYEFTSGMLLVPISIGYLLVGRFFLAKLFFASDKCIGCGLCAKICPVQAIDMHGDKNPRPFWTFQCESCMRCAAFCKAGAIEAGHSWGVLVYFLASTLIAVRMADWVASFAPWTGPDQSWLFSEIINSLFFLAFLFMLYRIFHVALKIPAINWLFTHTTLTHFWSRYLENDTKLKDLYKKK